MSFRERFLWRFPLTPPHAAKINRHRPSSSSWFERWFAIIHEHARKQTNPADVARGKNKKRDKKESVRLYVCNWPELHTAPSIEKWWGGQLWCHVCFSYFPHVAGVIFFVAVIVGGVGRWAAIRVCSFSRLLRLSLAIFLFVRIRNKNMDFSSNFFFC